MWQTVSYLTRNQKQKKRTSHRLISCNAYFLLLIGQNKTGRFLLNQNNKLLRSMITIILLLLLLYILINLLPVFCKVILFMNRLLLLFVDVGFISYLLQTFVAYLERRWKWSPAIALFIIFITFTRALAFLLYKSVPIFMIELQELSEQLPALIKDYEEMILSLYESTAFLPEAVHDKMDVFISKMET